MDVSTFVKLKKCDKNCHKKCATGNIPCKSMSNRLKVFGLLSEFRDICKLEIVLISKKLPGFPLVGEWRDPPPLPQKLACPPCLPLPTVLTHKCTFCNFHAVFDHFAQIVPPNQSTAFGKPWLLF